MKIGETIKKLRKKKDITQEKLADYLGITYQAVSKWENGTAMPDITLIVPLANYFGVSVNELFSFDEEANNEKVDTYLEKCQKLNHLGKVSDCIVLMREALAEYPRNFHIMKNLADALWTEGTGSDSRQKQNQEYFAEAIGLCERILEDCTEDGIRHDAIEILCRSYAETGQREKAVALASTMPCMYRSSDSLLGSILEGEERLKKGQENIHAHIELACVTLAWNARNFGGSNDEKIFAFETAIKIYEAIYHDGNLLFYHTRLAQFYRELAEYCTHKNPDAAMAHLLSAEKHAVASDKAKEKPAKYTSVFLNKTVYNPEETTKNYTETDIKFLLKNLELPGFSALSENPEFVRLRERLIHHEATGQNPR